MEHKAFRVFAMIFTVIGIVVASLFTLALLGMNAGIPFVMDLIGGNKEFFNKYLSVSIIGLFFFAFINLLSFILVSVGLRKDKLRRWYFLPGILGGFIAIGMVIGIIYFIIGIVSFFKADCIKYEGKEAHRHIIGLEITFLALGIIGSVLPLILKFDAASMSLLMFVGMVGVSVGTGLGTYFVCSPKSKCKFLTKLLTTVAFVGLNVGLFFLYQYLLKDNAARFDGDWPTIRTAIITATSMGGLLNISYFVFSLRHRDYQSYNYMLDISLGISILGLILANFLVLYWWLIIEAILWIWSFAFLSFLFYHVAPGGSSDGGYDYEITDQHGNKIKAESMGNGQYKGENGKNYREVHAGKVIEE